VECPARMARKPFLDLVLLMRRVVVEDHVDGLVLRHLALDEVEETDELLMPVPLHVLSNDRAVEHVECGKQRGRAMALVIMGHGPGTALLHRQGGLSTVKGLDLRLLVEGQHHCVCRRRDIQPDDVVQLLGKRRIVRQLEAAPAMWSKTMCLPDRLDFRDRKPDSIGHRARRPVGRLVRRRILRQADDLCHALEWYGGLAGRTGNVALEAIDTFVDEAFLPAPHTGLRLAGRRHDRRGAKTVATEQDDTGPPNVLLRAQRRRHNATQALAVGFGQRQSNTIAHPPRIAHRQASGNPQKDSFVPVNPLGAIRPNRGNDGAFVITGGDNEDKVGLA